MMHLDKTIIEIFAYVYFVVCCLAFEQLNQCSVEFQATAYGKCVSVKAEVTKHACSKEFEALIKCIKEVVCISFFLM